MLCAIEGQKRSPISPRTEVLQRTGTEPRSSANQVSLTAEPFLLPQISVFLSHIAYVIFSEGLAFPVQSFICAEVDILLIVSHLKLECESMCANFCIW